MVIPEVIQVSAGITTCITVIAPKRAYMQRVLGGFLIPLTRFCKTQGVLRIWQILSAQVSETGQEKETSDDG